MATNVSSEDDNARSSKRVGKSLRPGAPASIRESARVIAETGGDAKSEVSRTGL